ncbi:DNA-binding transcriptional regulator, AcrR family [Microlunatus sagamiharensis]|uniref:DNA-binding transcriptional regulator, AcrR family n=1 Tax=Microlunatus sagamiharensis TaxID=546874 RepID=A0A1H2MKG8_9ACTN|nr:TetR/AcrR family transcriptional regulator [Microlunatus sagamiharensis]SDU93733.1 DNA-binding transcriptional regulator, AcrR family [Microlunatus sagamiharensis]
MSATTTSTPGSTRRLTAKGEATRARIVDAASSLVFAHGVTRTGVEDIQREAGVSASQLYHYFGDKQTLMRAVIAHQTEAVLAAQRPELDSLDTFEALLRWRDRLVTLQRSRHCVGGCPIGSIAAEVADEDPQARADLVAGFEQWEAPLRSGLATMRDRGLLRPDTDTDRLALALLAALQGGLLLTQTRRTTVPLEAALDSMIELIRAYAA